MKKYSLWILHLHIILVLHFGDGQKTCNKTIPVPQEDLDLCTDPVAYEECVYEYSNIEDVKKFSNSQIFNLPEHVFCAYKCMAERCGLLTESGFLVIDKMMDFPALNKNFTWEKTFLRMSETCFKVFENDKVERCLDFYGPLVCFYFKALIGYPEEKIEECHYFKDNIDLDE